MTRLRITWVALLYTSALLIQACSPGQEPAGATPSATIAARPSSATAAASTPATRSPTETESPSAPSGDVPPPAYLGHDGTLIAGALRTYCWLDTCVDAFELPPMGSLPLLTLESSVTLLELRLADEAGFINWRASVGDGGMEDLRPLDDGGEEYDADTVASLPPMLTQTTVAAPPAGDWIVYVVIGGVEGEAHYAWQVSVP